MSRTGPIFEALVDRYYDGIDPDELADQALTELEDRANEARKERNFS
jgi:hypothetical protein